MTTRYSAYSIRLFALYIFISPTISQRIQCLGKQSCKNTKLTCNSGESCTLICDGDIDGQSCFNAELDASQAMDVTVHCMSTRDCAHMSIICADGLCDIQCEENQSCNQLSLRCGADDCSINCALETSCNAISIDTSSTSNFECSGFTDNCPSNIPSLIQTTMKLHTNTSTALLSTSSSIINSIQSRESTYFTMTDDDVVSEAVLTKKENIAWIKFVYLIIVVVVIVTVIILCVNRLYDKYETKDNPQKENNEDCVIEMKESDTNNNVTTNARTTTHTTSFNKYAEGERSPVSEIDINCMETSVLIGDNAAVSCTLDGDHCVDRSKIRLSHNTTLENILQDVMDDTVIKADDGRITPLFGAMNVCSPTNTTNTIRYNDNNSNLVTSGSDLVGEHDDDLVGEPKLCLNHSNTIDLNAIHITEIQLNYSTSIQRMKVKEASYMKVNVDDSALKLVIYDFDQTITSIHLYKELRGRGSNALKLMTNERLIEVFGGMQRIQRLRKHFEILNSCEIQIGILSFGYENVIKNVLQQIDLLHYFAFVVGRESDSLRKLKGEKAQFIANLKYANNEILFVDDDVKNIQSALNKDCCQTLLIQPAQGMNEAHLRYIECLI